MCKKLDYAVVMFAFYIRLVAAREFAATVDTTTELSGIDEESKRRYSGCL